MNRQKLRQRFLQDEWPRQVGNLAPTLARLSSRVKDARHDQIVVDLLREGALLIEWSAPNVPLELAAYMAAVQRELILWHRIWPDDAARSVLAYRARNISDRLLEAAGLV
jgi:hypothetical protein